MGEFKRKSMGIGRTIRYGLPVVLAAVIVAIAWQNRPPADVRISHDPVVRSENRPQRSSAMREEEMRVPQPAMSAAGQETAQAPLLSPETLSDPHRTREELLAIPLTDLQTIVGTKRLDGYVSRALQFNPENEEERAAAMQFLEQINERIRAAKK